MKLLLSLFILLSAIIASAQDITYFKAYEPFLPKDFITNINQKQVFHDRVKQIGSIDPTLVYLYIERFNTRADNRPGLDEMVNTGLRSTVRRRQAWLAAEISALSQDSLNGTESNVKKARDILTTLIASPLPDSTKNDIPLPGTPKLTPMRYLMAVIYLKQSYEPFSEDVNYENQYRYLVETRVEELNKKRIDWLKTKSIHSSTLSSVLKPEVDFWTATRPWERGDYWYPVIVAVSGFGLKKDDSGPGPLTVMATKLEKYLIADTFILTGLISGGLSSPVPFQRSSTLRAGGTNYPLSLDQRFSPIRLGYGASLQWKNPVGLFTYPFSILRFQISSAKESKTEPAVNKKSVEKNEVPEYEWVDETITEQKRTELSGDYSVKNWSISTTLVGYWWVMADLGFKSQTETYSNVYRHDLILTHNRYKTPTGDLIGSSVFASYVDRFEDRTVNKQLVFMDVYLKTPWFAEVHAEFSKSEPVFSVVAAIPLIPLPFTGE